MNKVFLIGRLTRNPELRYSSSNAAIVNFSIAIDRQYTNTQGQRETDFINIVAFQKQAENIKKYVSKGSLVAVDGRIQTRNYEDKDGKRVYVTEVVADKLQFLDNKRKDKESLPKDDKTIINNEVFSDFDTQIQIDETDIAW